MDTLDTTHPQDEESLARASVREAYYTFAGTPFLERVDEAFVASLLADELISALELMTKEEGFNSDFAEGLSLMLHYLESAKQREISTVADELGVDRTRLFRGVAQGYGPPPPLETLWTGPEKRENATLQQLAAEYRDARKDPSFDTQERLDYLGVELRYLISLVQDEKTRLQEGDAAGAREMLAKQYEFLARHLCSWAPRYIETALPEAKTSFYQGHLTFLRGLLTSDQEFLQDTLTPKT